MKKIFTLLCAAVIAVSTMNAEVLFNEHFAQTTETLSTSENAFANEIAATGWTNINGSGQIYMSSTDLTYAGYKSNSDATGSAEYKATFGKKVASPLSKSVNSGSVYAAAIINITASTPSAAPGRDYLWAFTPAKTGISTGGNHYGRLCIQKADDSFQFGVAKNAESAAYISYTETLPFGAYLVVLEYQFVDGDKNDVIKLYLNPTKGEKPAATLECKQSYINPSSGSDVGSGTKDDAAQLAAFMLYSTGTNKAALLLDELKVVTDWSDLWEAGEAPQTPTIIADQSFSFGNVNVNEAANKNLTIKGSNLKGAISIASNNAQLVVSAASVTKEAAESESGASVDLTLTATAAGEGSAKITLSSEDATNKVINVTWNAVEPLPSVTNIAAIKSSLSEWGDPVALTSQPVVIRVSEDAAVLQDESGAIMLVDMYGDYMSWKAGDKIKIGALQLIEKSDYVEGYPTIFAGSASVVSSGNAIEPLEVTLADFTKYGPAYIKVEGVSFPSDKEKFEAGGITISKDAASANMQIPAGCDIIGEDVPSKADVKGIVCHPYLTDNILISASADVYNRVARSATAIENIQSKGKAVKVVRNGQLIILRDGKEYNVLGVEK